jgi:hypothetical protein
MCNQACCTHIADSKPLHNALLYHRCMQLTLEEAVYMAAELQCIDVVLAQSLQAESCLQQNSSTVHVLSNDELWQYCCNRAAAFPQRYAVYRHFARKG